MMADFLRFYRQIYSGLLSAVLLCSFPMIAYGKDEVLGKYYRYRNSAGVQVIEFSIPSRYANKGYDILSSNGTLLKRVLPYKQKVRATVKQVVAQQEQEKKDAFILRSYSSLVDVEYARRRKEETIEREIEILKANFHEFVRRETALKSKAADYQASGRVPPETVLQVLAEVVEQQYNTREQIVNRGNDIKALKTYYDHHARRLLTLRPELAPRKS